MNKVKHFIRAVVFDLRARRAIREAQRSANLHRRTPPCNHHRLETLRLRKEKEQRRHLSNGCGTASNMATFRAVSAVKPFEKRC